MLQNAQPKEGDDEQNEGNADKKNEKKEGQESELRYLIKFGAYQRLNKYILGFKSNKT